MQSGVYIHACIVRLVADTNMQISYVAKQKSADQGMYYFLHISFCVERKSADLLFR